ncbi:MAG: aspartate kinase [Verrucomicrobia bacterium]|nr:aspartate kinase [Verrucomicrobiota bacterium]
MKVCKFGGTSMADAQQMLRVCAIVESDPARRIVVVSAPGKRQAKDAKVTDLLIACGEAVLAGGDGAAARQAVVARFSAIEADLNLGDAISRALAADLAARQAADRSHKGRYMDALKAAGEDYAARVLAAVLQKRGRVAAYVNPRDAGMLLSDEYGQARLLPESNARLATLRDHKGIVVFPGFFGYTRDGVVVTFSRGGSDITGSILAVAVKAEIYENFTDVDSVFAVDPRLVPEAVAIQEMTYREMRELAYAGFSVLHDEAVIPAFRAGIPIQIRNTNRPEAPGTMIVPEHRAAGARRVVGIASDAGFCSINVSKYLMNREIGFGRKVLQILEDESISYEHSPSGIDTMSVIIKEAGLTIPAEKRVLERLQAELQVDDASIERGLALVMIVGEGMRFNVGMAARVTRALADAGVNIEMMNQGASEISMMFGVKATQRQQAVNSLYRALFGGQGNGAGRETDGGGST